MQKARKKTYGLFALLMLLLLMISGCTNKEALSLRNEAVAKYQAGEYEQAETLFTEALNASKGEVSELQTDIIKYRAECALRLGKFDEAMEDYDVLIKIDGSKKDEEAVARLRKEMQNIDTVREALKEMEAGEYDRAYTILSRVAALDGSISGKEAWFNKAVCCEFQGHYMEARQLFDQYLADYPNDAAARKELTFLETR